MTTEKMLDEIRKLIAKCDASELSTYEALLEEAEGWRMRADLLEHGENDGGED